MKPKLLLADKHWKPYFLSAFFLKVIFLHITAICCVTFQPSESCVIFLLGSTGQLAVLPARGAWLCGFPSGQPGRGALISHLTGMCPYYKGFCKEERSLPLCRIFKRKLCPRWHCKERARLRRCVVGLLEGTPRQRSASQ